MSPVWRLGRIVGCKQRRAIDVSLEIADTPERHAPPSDVESRELGGIRTDAARKFT
jgi:hypothetical protein